LALRASFAPQKRGLIKHIKQNNKLRRKKTTQEPCSCGFEVSG
jgi:hypothetical protein